MPDTKTSALAALTGANLAATDLAMVVDVSDTSMAASGTNVKMTIAEFFTSRTHTGLLTLTGAANTGIVASTGYSLTGSNATNMLDFAGTWNTSGAPTLLKIDVTNTASGAASMLANITVGSATALSLSKTTILTIGTASSFTGALGQIVPTTDGEGQIGTTARRWGTIYAFTKIGVRGDSGVLTIGAADDVILRRGGAAATLQLGSDVNGAAVAQTIIAHAGITGTDVGGAGLTIGGGLGTGAGAGGGITISTPTTLGTGTTAQTRVARVTISQGAVTTDAATITLADKVDVVLNATTGTKIGTATTQKLGLWGVTPVIQQASADQAVVSLDVDVTGADLVDKAAINSNFTAIQTLLNRLRLDLTTIGAIKGAA